MAYRNGDRDQMHLLPPSIEEYVTPADPVRAYNAFVDSLSLDELGIIEDEHKVGNSEYHPKTMIKLIVYGCSYGLRSSRKLERATYHNLAFMWLMGGLNPDHKTISRFRKNNRDTLKNILKQCVRLCIKLDLIEGNTLFVDGTKIRANASIGNTWTPAKCERYLKKVDQHIESILTECDTIDEQEQDHPSLVKLKEELQDKEHLKSRVKDILKELKEQERESINTTDPDCVKVKGRQGIHAGYNGQIVVDKKHGLIVTSDVVNESNDVNQFAHQIEQSNQTLGHKCTNVCADAGYSDIQELKKIDDQHARMSAYAFGHIKRNLGVTAFLLRGVEGVKAEMSLLASCFDITRMINIVGVPLLVAILRS
jgi:transposase